MQALTSNCLCFVHHPAYTEHTTVQSRIASETSPTAEPKRRESSLTSHHGASRQHLTPKQQPRKFSKRKITDSNLRSKRPDLKRYIRTHEASSNAEKLHQGSRHVLSYCSVIAAGMTEKKNAYLNASLRPTRLQLPNPSPAYSSCEPVKFHILKCRAHANHP